ncbi:retrovirus-related pol polyprotein from transposon TNT 1-94 [Tanacetum coccineum]
MKWPLHLQLPHGSCYFYQVMVMASTFIHLNFDTINDLAKNDLVTGLLKFKYHTEHLCPSCEQGKSKRASHPPKPVPNSKQRLHLLHMDLCGPMRVESINGKWYVLKIIVLLQAPAIIVRTNNGTEFKNQVLQEYFNSIGISHQASSVRTPQQNGVVERRNRTLVEAARTMLIFSRAPLFLWAEAIATAGYTQNRSIIHHQFDKTPYELINGRKPDISFLYVFGALCYPKNDREDIGKLGAKGDIGFFIAMVFEQRSSKPGLQSMTSGQISSGLDLTYAPSIITTQQPTERKLDLLFEAMYDDYIGGQPSAAPRTVSAAQAPQDIDELETQQHHVPNAMLDGNTFVNPVATPSTSVTSATAGSSQPPATISRHQKTSPASFPAEFRKPPKSPDLPDPHHHAPPRAATTPPQPAIATTLPSSTPSCHHHHLIVIITTPSSPPPTPHHRHPHLHHITAAPTTTSPPTVRIPQKGCLGGQETEKDAFGLREDNKGVFGWLCHRIKVCLA